MNTNLEALMEKLVDNYDIAKSFSKMNTIDEMYEFCTLISGGYTKEEFEEFIIEMLQAVDESDCKELSDIQVESVSGGLSANNVKNKVLSMALAALTATSGAAISSSAVGAKGHDSVSPVKSSSVIKSGSKWDKFKDFCSKNKKWLIGGGVAAGVLAGIGLTWGLTHKSKNVPDQPKGPAAEKDTKLKGDENKNPPAPEVSTEPATEVSTEPATEVSTESAKNQQNKGQSKNTYDKITGGGQHTIVFH